MLSLAVLARPPWAMWRRGTALRPCRSAACVASVRLADLQDGAAGEAVSTDGPSVGLSMAWVGESALAVVTANRQDDVWVNSVYVMSSGGLAAELLVESGDACQVAAELDGAVVLGDRSWSLLRAVPAAVRRVRLCSPRRHCWSSPVYCSALLAMNASPTVIIAAQKRTLSAFTVHCVCRPWARAAATPPRC